MQIFANVSSDPQWNPAKTAGRKGYWMWRAGEPQKDVEGQKQESTWYTVKDFSPEAQPPAYAKGDFVKILGSLQPAYWMDRSGKPNGTLYVTVFSISMERKKGGGNPHRNSDGIGDTHQLPTAAASTQESLPVVGGKTDAPAVAAPVQISSSILHVTPASNELDSTEIDECYLRLIA